MNSIFNFQSTLTLTETLKGESCQNIWIKKHLKKSIKLAFGENARLNLSKVLQNLLLVFKTHANFPPKMSALSLGQIDKHARRMICKNIQ